jgi:hypothetical protein
MTNPTQAAPAASIKPSVSVADDKNKTGTDATQNDTAAQPNPGVKSEPAVSAKV